MKPRLVMLGRIGGTTRYRDEERKDVVPLPDGIIAARFEDQLYFGNASYFKNEVRECVRKYEGEELRHLLLDAFIMHDIDSTGMYALKEMDEELRRQGILLHLCGLIGPTREALLKSGLFNASGRIHLTTHNAVEAIERGDYDITDVKVI